MFILKQLIQAKGYKQKWLAQKLGVSEVTISNWVSGKTTPKEEHLKKLCEILEVNPEILFNNL